MTSDFSNVEPNVELAELVRAADEKFRELFGRVPRWIAAAPGRVNLIGEHTDYNDGFVLPMAIDRYVVVAADRAGLPEDSKGPMTLRLFSSAVGAQETVHFRKTQLSSPGKWSSYVAGVVACLGEVGMDPGSLELVIESNLPLGGGLSSSAALEVATATLIEAMTDRTLDDLDKIKLCQRAEHEYANVPCGIMDQFSVVMGRPDAFMLLDCRSLEVRYVPLTDPKVSVLVINTNVKHELAGSEYPLRRAQCEEAARVLGVPRLRDVTLQQLQADRSKLDSTSFRRARHVVTEIQRTTEAAEAIRASRWDRVGELMYASHNSLRDDYEVSCTELDLLVELADRIGESGGVIGSRMTGGGFGGCTVSLVRTNAVSAVARTIGEGYRERTSTEASIFVTRPSQGARIVRQPGKT